MMPTAQPYYNCMPMMMPVQQQQMTMPMMYPYQMQPFASPEVPQTMSNREFYDEPSHFISLKKGKRSQQQLPNYMPHYRTIDGEVDDELENQAIYRKPERKFWTFEDFKSYTLPKLQLRKIV